MEASLLPIHIHPEAVSRLPMIDRRLHLLLLQSSPLIIQFNSIISESCLMRLPLSQVPSWIITSPCHSLLCLFGPISFNSPDGYSSLPSSRDPFSSKCQPSMFSDLSHIISFFS
ncbi:hypothetical protein RchiOBHm_Chr4g0387601 [Rosa chinensis]|uniref:Uncharacterized protein n=1 Tax=Rosa chinensis TaxID=74649 RepID=A0A2P6QPH2_ROSCH|nr:hypothetical protein RchiOBHm_Chr4g0387601 [Rosa chinensis]